LNPPHEVSARKTRATGGTKRSTPRLWFVDFWGKRDARVLERVPLYRALSEHFDLQLDPVNPEFLLCSVYGNQHYRYNCPKVLYVSENIFPDFHKYDWAFSVDPTEGRNFRLPLWSIWMGNPRALLRPIKDPAGLLKRKERFCAFVYTNPNCEQRNEFFRVLSSKKHVDAAGRLFNNTVGLSDRFEASTFSDLPGFYSRYKFTIAFENASAPGWTTEKLVAPLLGGSIPIYWGDPGVTREFNPEAFINAHDFGSLEELANHVLKVDTDDDLYLRYLSASRLQGNALPEDADWGVLAERFERIFSEKIEPISARGFAYRRFIPLLPTPVLRKMRRVRQRKLYRHPAILRNPTIAPEGGSQG